MPVADYLLTQDLAKTYWEVPFWDAASPPERLFVNLPDPAQITAGWTGLGWWAFVALALILALLVMGRFGQRTGIVARLFGLEILLIWMSSEAFPWYLLRRHLPPVYELLTNMQFAWRLLGVAGPILVLLSLWALQACAKETVSGGEKTSAPALFDGAQLKGLFALAFLVLSMVQVSDYEKELFVTAHSITAYDRAVLPIFLKDEFSIEGADVDLPYRRTQIDLPEGSSGSATITARRGLTVIAELENPGSEAISARFPLWCYKGYRAHAASGDLAVTRAEDMRVAVEIPAGFAGAVTVSFHEPWYWRLAELVSLATVIGLIVLVLPPGTLKQLPFRHGKKGA